MMINFNKQFIFLILITFSILFTACSNKQPSANHTDTATKPIIAVSIVPQETFVKAVAGDLVDIVTLIPPGNSPENYAPTPQQMQKFSQSVLYFSIGVPTEKANILPKAYELNKNIKIVEIEKEIAKVYPERFFESEEIHSQQTGRDPHIWLSPKRVKVMIEIIASELSLLDPAHKEIYAKNAATYIEKLTQLDKTIKHTLENISNQTFIISHPSFGYFADDYDLTMIAIEKEGKTATIDNLQKIVDLAKEKNVKVIFYQAEFDSRQADIIAKEIGGKAVQIAPLAPNYIENITIIAKAFAETLH